MSKPDQDFDLELHFLPAWAQKPSQATHYAEYETRGDARRGGDRREGRDGPRPPRRRDDRSPNRGGQRPPGAADSRGPRPQGGGDRRGGDRGKGPRSHDQGQRPREESRPPAPLPEVQVSFIPDDKGVDSLARQIKMTGRAYPLFEIA